MSSYVVEIFDQTETFLKIKVELLTFGQNIWTALEPGVWAFNSGLVNIIDKTNYKNNQIVYHKHLNICNNGEVSWAGVTLWDFQGSRHVNRSGSGIVAKGWTSLKKTDDVCLESPKIIRWKVVG